MSKNFMKNFLKGATNTSKKAVTKVITTEIINSETNTNISIKDQTTHVSSKQSNITLNNSNLKINKSVKKLNHINTDNINLIPFSIVSNALAEIETIKGENSKDKIKTVLSNIFYDILINYQEDLSRLYYFLMSKVGPEYRCPELGIGKETILKCVSKATGKTDKAVKQEMKEIGDLGTIASKGKSTLGTFDKFKDFCFKNNNTNNDINNNSNKDEITSSIVNESKSLSLKQITESISKLATVKGKDSFDAKEQIIVKIMFACKSNDIKFYVRSLERNLKVGASFKTVIAALSRALSNFYRIKRNIEIDEKDIDKTIQKCIYQSSDYDLFLHNILELTDKEYLNNIKQKSKNNTFDFKKELFDKCKIIPGVPIKPMLAKPTTGVNMVASRFDNVPFSCEFKYDGFRGQIHYVKDKTSFFNSESSNSFFSLNNINLFKDLNVQIYSRNLENMTEIYPDIVNYFSKLFINMSSNNIDKEITSCILDCEIVPFDAKTDKILPFQLLTTRSRKNVKQEDIKIKVCCFLFDIIYLNEKDLCNHTLNQRRDVLKDYFLDYEDENFKLTKYINSQNPEDILAFMDDAIKSGCEGLIVKALDLENSNYQPGERNFNWLKLKKDYMKDSTIGDSLDLVPIGAEYGKGKRTGAYGSFLLACYNEDNECFETVSMTGAGLKDENLKNFHEILSKTIIKNPLSNYKINNNTKVDVWFEPTLVWEIKTADLSLSPVYTAGSSLINNNNSNKGISLRFPRFIKSRDDKKPFDATSSEEIFRMYNEQAMNENNIKKYTLKKNNDSDDE